MKALRLLAHGCPGTLAVQTVDDPVPGPGEVVVSVKACGLNHLDLWMEEAGLPTKVELPRTPGGEVAGVVAEVGKGVSDWVPGDRVAVQSNLFCGQCEFCLRQEESLCLAGRLLGVDCDGGFAERCRVPSRALVRLPDGVPFEASAALTLAGSTAMHMLVDRVQVTAGQWVLVAGGASGVGAAAIQIARALGARVVTTASTEAKRAFCETLGAELVVDPSDEAWPAAVRHATGKRGVDIVVEHVGGTFFERLFQCLARGGAVVTCGATSGRQVSMNLWPFFVKQQRVIGSYGRTRKDMIATLAWLADGRLRPNIDQIVDLEHGVEAFRRLRGRDVCGKLVLVPG